MREIEAPDGTILEFPASMSDDKIRDVMRRKYPKKLDVTSFGSDWHKARAAIDKLPEDQRQAKIDEYAKFFVAKEREDGGILQSINDHVRMFSRNVPLVGEHLDELNAGTAAATGGDYQMALAAERARRKAIDSEDRAGVDFGLGEIDTGDVAKAGGFVAGAVATPIARVGGAIATGAVNAGAAAASDAAGASEGTAAEKAVAGATAAPAAAAGGALIARGGQAIANYANRGRIAAGATRSAPDSNTLRARGRRHYQRAEQAGAIVSGTNTNAAGRTFAEELQHQVHTELAGMSYAPRNAPGTAGVLGDLQELTNGQNITFSGIDALRKSFSGVARNSNNDTSRAVAGRVIGNIDDMLIDASHANSPYLLQGNGRVARNALVSARRNWRRAAKTRMVEDAIERAQNRAASTGTGGNINNATRQEFRRIVDNPRMARGFSPAERGAMRELDIGTPGRNAARFAGSFSPTSGGLAQAGNIWAGVETGGLSAIASGAAYGARAAADRGTTRLAATIRDAVATDSLIRRYNPLQRTIQAFANGSLSEPALRLALRGHANDLSKKTEHNEDRLFDAMFSKAVGKAPTNDFDRVFKTGAE